MGRSRGLGKFVAGVVTGATLLVVPAGAAEAATLVSTTGTTFLPAGQQTGRLDADGIPSDCTGTTFKFEPTVENPADMHTYNNHTFINRLTHPVCVTATFSSLTSCTIFSVAYVGQFNPANILENYAADIGSPAPGGTQSYAFRPGGGQLFGIVVHERTPGAGCGGYNLTVTSDRPFANSSPAISGSPTPGSVLTGTNSTWANPAPTVARQWVRCNSTGSSCDDIPGATGATYTVTNADVGATIRFRNHATDADGTSTSQSRFVEPFIPFESHSGSLGPGDRVLNGLFVRNGVETACGVPNAPPTVLFPTDNYLYDAYPVTSLLNESVCLAARTAPTSCTGGVTPQIYDPAFDATAGLAASYRGNSGEPATSPNAVGVPIGAGERREVVVSRADDFGSCNAYGVAIGTNTPFATTRPAVSGTPTEGETLTTSEGTWSGTPAIGYSWRRCDASGGGCAPIDGATESTYTPTAADAGSRLRVRVSATQGQTVSSDSAPTDAVAAAPPVGDPPGGGDADDRDPPDGRIVKVKRKGDDVKVKFRSDEPDSTYRCRLDKKRFKPCTSPKRYRNLKDGKHRFFLVATDPAGNEDDKAAKAKFRIR